MSNPTPTTLKETLLEMEWCHAVKTESLDQATQSIKEQLKALLEPFHYSETPSPCGVQRTGRWKRPCDCGLDQAIEEWAKLIDLLGKRIDQIWTFLEVAGIAEPIAQPRKD